MDVTQVMTELRQLAHMEWIGFFLALMLAYPLTKGLYLRLDRVPRWPFMASCVFGILWFSGLFVSTGKGTSMIDRALLIPFLAVTEFTSVNAMWLWFGLLIRASVHFEPRRKTHTGHGAMGD